MRRLTATACVLALAATTACTRTIRIKPQDLPSLNGAHTTQVGTTSNTVPRTVNGKTTYTTQSTPVMASSVFHVTTLEGTTDTVEGRFDVTLRTTAGAGARFEYPVIADLKGDALSVRGKRQPEQLYPLGDLQYAGVEVQDRPMTTLAWIGVTGALSIAAIMLVKSSISSRGER